MTPDSVLSWRKSSYSGGGNDCVEVAFDGDVTAVRDSKNPDVGSVRFGRDQWQDLLAAIRAGKLGQPLLCTASGHVPDARWGLPDRGPARHPTGCRAGRFFGEREKRRFGLCGCASLTSVPGGPCGDA